MSKLIDFLTKQDPKSLLATVLVLLLGILLRDFVPFAWRFVGATGAWVGRLIGGRFAFRYFERTYLDWLVTKLRELNLTGIVSNDTTKKPQLEQVFVSLRMGGERNSVSFMECTIAVCNEIRRNPHRRRTLLEALKRDLERASSDQRKEAEEYIARSVKEKKNREVFGLSPADLLVMLFLRSSFLGRLIRSMSLNMTMDGIANAESAESAYASTLFNEILRGNQRLVILGAPGAGKSTLLQYVGLAYARARAGDSKLRRKKCHQKELRASGWRLPIFVPLSLVSKALADPLPNGNRRTILDILPTILPPDLQNDLALKFFKKRISAGECIILFDGLDEVPTEEEFKVVVESIESFTLAHPKNQYILTSRIAGWRSGVRADFRVFYLAELSESQIETFITTWCEAVELNAVVGRLKDEGQADRANRRRRALQHSTQLKEAIKSNRGMRQLASNPMLLSIIALVHYSLPDLPKERTKLYSDCSKLLLEQWDMSKGRRVDDTRLSLEQKEAILRRIAFALHTGEIGKKGGSREADRQEVQKLIATLLPNFNKSASDSERLLTRLIERSGIIIERQRDILAFSHLTFQEYFVASYLAKSRSADFLLQEERIFTDWWHEVAVMYSGLLEDSSEFLKALQNHNHSDPFSTKLLLAGICLGESQVVKQISVRESICTDLVRLYTLGQLTGPSADFRELSGYLTDWSRSDTARKKAVAFAIKCALESGNGEAHLEKLAIAIREGDPEDAGLYISAVQTLPGIPIAAISEAICAHIRRRDSRTSIEAIKLIAGAASNTPRAVLSEVFEAAFSDPDPSVRAGAIDALAIYPENAEVLSELYPSINILLSDANWRTRQSAAKVYAHYVQCGVAGATNRLFELIEKEADEDVLEAAFDSLARASSTPESKEVLEKTVRLLKAKREKVRALALDSVLKLLDQPAQVSGVLRLIGEFFGTKSELFIAVLNKGFCNLRDPNSITVSVKHLLIITKTGSAIERANALPLLAVMREHSTATREIDRQLAVALKSGGRKLKVGAARAIGVCNIWNCDEDSYRILLSMANSRSTKTRLSALQGICATISPTRASSTVEALRRGLSSSDSHMRSVAARAIARLGKAGSSLRDDLLNSISSWPAYADPIYGSRLGILGQIRSFVFFSGDDELDADAQESLRRALVAVTTTKGEFQQLIELIAQRIADSKKPYFSLVPLVRTIGLVAEKHCSLKSLECLLRVLHLLEEGLEGVDLRPEFVFFGLPFAMTPGGEMPLQTEIMAVGKKLHGRDVTKRIRQALENQGAISKVAILRALPEFEANVRNELITTIKEIANNDAPRVRNEAWNALRTINLARKTWHTIESAPPVADTTPTA